MSERYLTFQVPRNGHLGAIRSYAVIQWPRRKVLLSAEHALADWVPMNLEIVRETNFKFANNAHAALLLENMKSCFFHHLDRCCWGSSGHAGSAHGWRRWESTDRVVIVREVGKVTHTRSKGSRFFTRILHTIKHFTFICSTARLSAGGKM